MAFLEDPRLRQRWNQISQTTETVTENAAAGIWTFGHTYLNPCLGSICSAFDGCAACCLGDHEERARRRRERERARATPREGGGQGSGGGGGIFKGWHHEDWDRLLAGTGTSKKGPGEIHEQPQSSKRGMSYGTREARRKSSTAEDPTIIPSTQPIGFLGRLPFKFGGPLRYKPSAANLQEHPGRHGLEGEHEPLLGGADDHHEAHFMRFVSVEGDLFPSDGEGDEDAIPLDDEFADEFAVALDRVASTDDRSSNKTRSSKGKRKASSAYSVQRSASRTTLGSTYSRHSSSMLHQTPELAIPQVAEPSVIEDLQYEEEQLRQQEDEEIERKRQAAAQLALERGLHRDNVQVESVPEAKAEMVEVDDMYAPEQAAEVLTVEYSLRLAQN
ncbi:hypothetical protein PG987_007928 [Apiospora arundinis]